MAGKIFPRNLTARAAHVVVGNPVTTRMESSVANCFPGLEFDVRNLDCRFFPGLLFQYVTKPLRPVASAPPHQEGARLLYVDYLEDPMLPETSEEAWVQTLLTGYRGDVGTTLSSGLWYLDWVEQKGKRLVTYDAKHEPYDGELVWRLVRSLEPDAPIRIGLSARNTGGVQVAPVELSGYRRRYVNAAGLFDSVYRPGELTESMCNPWSHDFRDCACHYWASNHPDVVMGEVKPGQALPDGESKNPQRAATYLDWLRDDRKRSGAAAASATILGNRPFQIDHYQINFEWERLRFVLENREIGEEYRRVPPPTAKPFGSPRELIAELEEVLAPMELTLALEYLYALFSVRAPDEAPKDRWPTMADDLAFVRQFVTLVAVGEMTHLRWANQILWELDRAGLYPKGKHYQPVIKLSKVVPGPSGERAKPGKRKDRPRSLRPLDQAALADFIATERPLATLDTAYARCVATLKEPGYPEELYELAVRVDTDGSEHYNRFRDVKQVLKAYEGAGDPYLRPVKVGTPAQAKVALASFEQILEHLRRAYACEAKRDFAGAEQAITAARGEMMTMHAAAEDLARKGIGIPFWKD